MSQYWPFSGLTRYGALRERLIVSLDLGDRREALKMVDQLGRSGRHVQDRQAAIRFRRP